MNVGLLHEEGSLTCVTVLSKDRLTCLGMSERDFSVQNDNRRSKEGVININETRTHVKK